MLANSTLSSKKIILLLGDSLLLYFSLWLTLLIRYQNKFSGALWQDHLIPFSVIFILWLVTFYISNLYEFNNIRNYQSLLSQLFQSFIFNSLIATAFFYLGQNRLFTIRPQRVLIINVLLALILIYGWRLIFVWLTKINKTTNHLMVIGKNALVAEIYEEITPKPELGFKIKIGISNNLNDGLDKILPGIKIFNDFKNLKEICTQYKINTIISTIHPRQSPELSKSLFECLPLKISFFDIATFYESITGKIPVNTIEQVWFLENFAEGSKKFYDRLKRVFDFFLASILLIISLPLTPLICLMIKLGSHGPIFFTQIRNGKDSKNFKIIKFRSMVIDAEKNGPQWAQINDPRITKIGKFLRKTRLDEIPQLINVLKGEMSLIGPRPERPEFVNELENKIPFYRERLLVKPGLSGWAQIKGPAYGGSAEESLEKLQYDLYYIKNRSFVLDLSIILKTVGIILSRQGQ